MQSIPVLPHFVISLNPLKNWKCQEKSRCVTCQGVSHDLYNFQSFLGKVYLYKASPL